MTDIVDRLNDSLSAGYSELRKEAAAEIMQLRAKIYDLTINIEYFNKLKTSYEELIGELQEERDALKQARLNGMGASREAALMAKLEAAEKEVAHIKEVEFPRKARAVAVGWETKCARLEQERDELRTELKEVRYGVAAAHDTIKTLHAKIEQMEEQEPVAWCATDETGTVIEALGMNQSRRFDTALYLAPGAQPTQKAVAYLDLGVGGYMDIGTDLTDEQLASLPKGRHMLGIVGTYGVDGYVSAQPAPSLASDDVSLISEGKTQPAQSVKDDIIDDLQSQFDTEGITEHDSGDALIRLSDAIAAVEDNFAQPAPIEQDTSVRKAWARFSNELHRSPDAPYPGMADAFERHFSQSFTDREWRAESATWAAAWKAAKNHGAQAQPAPSIPEGWLRAIDEALIVAHIGVANESDTYEQAKAKLDNLISFHVDVATDPAVNGGWKLVPIEPTPRMMRGAHRLVAAARRVLASADSQGLIRLDESGDVASELRSALEAAPEAKP